METQKNFDQINEIINGIIISTGGISEKFEIIDTIFAMNTALPGAAPDEVLEKVKHDLAAKCRSLGGDAALDCQFEYRTPEPPACFGVVDIIVFATAVKIVTQ